MRMASHSSNIRRLRTLVSRLTRHQNFKKEFHQFKSASVPMRFAIDWEDRYPRLNDKTSTTGFDRHYIYHTAWAARVLASTRPEEHVDIASSLYFIALVSAFVPIRFYDYRPAEIMLDGVCSEAGNLLSLSLDDESVQSLSCMHVIEHVGLGRYGDPIDPNADLKAISELKRILAKGGDFLFVVPVGQPKVMFNAHRIYSYGQIISYFKELELVEFTLIPDNPQMGGIIANATEAMADAQNYGCGCFWFRKKCTG